MTLMGTIGSKGF